MAQGRIVEFVFNDFFCNRIKNISIIDYYTVLFAVFASKFAIVLENEKPDSFFLFLFCVSFSTSKIYKIKKDYVDFCIGKIWHVLKCFT